MTGELEVTVLLPCLDEAETVGTCVRKARRSLAALGIAGEVLVSDNGSRDSSPEIAARHGARLVAAPTPGYGGALLTGIENARGRYVIMADADDSYDLTDLGPFVTALREGYDHLVMGNRFRGGIAADAMPWLHRRVGNPVLSWLGRRLFDLRGVGDFHCGMRGFRRDRVRALGLCMPGMEFASEMVVRAALAGYRIAEVPTTLRPDGRNRPSHLRTWRDGWRHLRFLLVFAPKKTLVLPGALLATAGIAGTALLGPAPRSIGSVTFDVNALAYACAAVLVGVEMMLLGGLGELYGWEASLTRRRPAAWTAALRLETAAAVGLALAVLGLLGSAAAVEHWRSLGFGELDPRGTIRLVLPSVSLVALGVLWIFTGLVGSLITLRGVDAPRADAARPHPESPPGRTPSCVAMNGPRLGICEDDAELRSVLVRALGDEGYEVSATATGRDAVREFSAAAPDVLVLDIALPDSDGRDVCQALRAHGVDAPVIFLTARGALTDRLAGFHAGGDDYLTKPFALAELLVRVRALLRRGGADAAHAPTGLRLDAATHALRAGEHAEALTPTEFRLLAALVARPGDVLRRRELVAAAWPDGAIVHDNTLDSYIRRLRRKLRDVGASEEIATSRGVGYTLRRAG